MTQELLARFALPLLTESGLPEALPAVRPDAPEAQENQTVTPGHTPVIHSIVVHERR